MLCIISDMRISMWGGYMRWMPEVVEESWETLCAFSDIDDALLNTMLIQVAVNALEDTYDLD